VTFGQQPIPQNLSDVSRTENSDLHKSPFVKNTRVFLRGIMLLYRPVYLTGEHHIDRSV
jgi:hypothetical protein